MTKSKKHPFNQFGESVLGVVLLLYLWTALSVMARLQSFNPLMFSLREQYGKIRGLQ
jgi:hypothetical protein